MADRMGSEGYQQRKAALTIPGGAFQQPNCMSRNAYARLNPNFDRTD